MRGSSDSRGRSRRRLRGFRTCPHRLELSAPLPSSPRSPVTACVTGGTAQSAVCLAVGTRLPPRTVGRVVPSPWPCTNDPQQEAGAWERELATRGVNSGHFDGQCRLYARGEGRAKGAVLHQEELTCGRSCPRVPRAALSLLSCPAVRRHPRLDDSLEDRSTSARWVF